MVHEHIVVLRFAVGIAEDAVIDAGEAQRLDVESSLFENLALHALDDGLSGLEHAAGERPLAFHGDSAAENEEHSALSVKDDGADAEEWTVRIFAAHANSVAWGPSNFLWP